jgi:hypothetical protein
MHSYDLNRPGTIKDLNVHVSFDLSELRGYSLPQALYLPPAFVRPNCALRSATYRFAFGRARPATGFSLTAGQRILALANKRRKLLI